MDPGEGQEIQARESNLRSGPILVSTFLSFTCREPEFYLPSETKIADLRLRES